MVSADSYFKIGSSHRICQDYAEHSSGHPWPVARLSDGCSSAPLTDWGARFLVRAAARLTTCGMPVNLIAARALSMAHASGTTLECLNATLLTAELRADCLRASVVGDGVVVARRHDGRFEIAVIEYPSGAPFYPRYSLQSRSDTPYGVYTEYLAKFGRAYQVKRYTWAGGTTSLCGGSVEERQLPDDPSCHVDVFEFSRLEYDLLLILSDGIHSFTRPLLTDTGRTTVPIPLADLFGEFLAFKSFKGEFVARRCAAAFKAIHGYGWSHHDDFSMAAVYASEVQG